MRYVRHIPMLLLWLLSAPLSHASDQPPVAVITYAPEHPSFQVYDGERILFDGLGSYDPDGGAITDYQWYVNATMESEHSSTFTWTFDIASGTSQSVKLRVKDNEGGWSETTLTFTVLQRVRRYYYVKDHLGSVRATVDESGDLVGYDDYYPFGLRMENRSLDYGASAREKYTGHELDGESGLLYAGARYYDPVIARFLSIDRFVEKYPGLSPYHYTRGNPINYIDVNGDSLDVSEALKKDKEDGTNYVQDLISNLEGVTGLQLAIVNGKIVLKQGNRSFGSQTAAEFLQDAISHQETVAITFDPGGDSRVEPSDRNTLYLDPEEIAGLTDPENVSPNLNPNTMGMGMMFFHELTHSAASGVMAPFDPGPIEQYSQTGQAVDMVNRIRKELGSDYGQRMTYGSYPILNKNNYLDSFGILAFDELSLSSAKNGNPPPNNSLYIKRPPKYLR